jgi:acetyl esterase
VPFAGTIEDRALEGPEGAFSVRIYTPPGPGPFPLMVYLHGGGFIVGNPDYTDAATRIIATRAPAIVVSVDYRLAPEARYPAAVIDSEFAVQWAIENSTELNIRPGPIAVGGDSAGGNLSAVTSQRDRASGRNQIGLQVLIYPAVDAARRDRESQVAFAKGFGLSLKDVTNCFDFYAPEGADVKDPGLSPIFATSLEGQPKALVFTAGFDVLRDEGTEYAELLDKAGVEVEHIREPHVPHGYITMTRVCNEAEESLERIAGAVRQLTA